MILIIGDPQGVLLDEIKLPGVTQKSLAATYAYLMVQDLHGADWPRVNAAILKRWPKGLTRVKEMAHKQVNQWRAAP